MIRRTTGNNVHEGHIVAWEILSNLLLLPSTAHIAHNYSHSCWSGLKRIATGNEDAANGIDYVGDPMLLHHRHPNDMPAWAREVLTVGKIYTSGPHAARLALAAAPANGEMNEEMNGNYYTKCF